MRIPSLVLLLAAGISHAAEIPKGSHALLSFINAISTRTAREGDYVYLKTSTPIVNNGEIVVPTNSYVQGIVTHSKRSGRVKGVAELGIRIETLTLPSGKVVKMTPTLSSIDSGDSEQKIVGKESEIKQGTSHGTDAAVIAGTSGAGAALGGLTDRSWRGAGIGAAAGSGVGLATVLLTRGREVELKQGSTVDVVFQRAVPID
jgi:type IV secretion system protein VirB10